VVVGAHDALFERTLEKSSQLAVRWIVVLVFALALLASELGLDLLLGGFAAGMITRQVLKEREMPGFDSKLTAVAFGSFIAFFFVVSGMDLDVDALFASASGVVKLVIFFALFVVVRGTPALLLYRRVPDPRERLSLAFFTSTQVPLVLAITTVARETGRRRSGPVDACLSDPRPAAPRRRSGRAARGGRAQPQRQRGVSRANLVAIGLALAPRSHGTRRRGLIIRFG
jgi:Kef-type K+ transport system membrane component KefB